MQAVLEQLKDIMGDGYVTLLDAFLADAPKRLDLMQAAVSENNLEQLAEESHSLKGSSSNLGATELAGICSELSDGYYSGTLTELEQKVRTAFELYAEVEHILEQEKQSL
jgi:HPt (histidine-containing phosphotransfer) domain-containing protein